MKNVTRTIETHTISSATVEMVDGVLQTTPLKDIKVSNITMNTEKALKLVRKTYGKKDNYVITSIFTDKTTYGLPFDKFMELAEIINTDE